MPTLVLPYPAIDPVLISIGPFAIRWYALAYIAGILLGWWYARRLAAREELWRGRPAMTPTDIDDFVVWATLGIVLGGRLGYVLFYKPAFYLANPLEIFQVWQGGMAFHGGFLGVVVAMILFARNRRINVWSLFDVIAASVPFGLFFGRIANFINAELFGRPTDVPWAMVFPTDHFQLPRHPSQLYEATLEGIVLFLLLRLLTHKAKVLDKPGFIAGAFAALYGCTRVIGEFFRMPDAHIGFLAGGLTMGMLLSLPMILVGIALMTWAARRKARAAGSEGAGAPRR
ncbi:phosphatidylglycerol:prolipoprotein diacylglycerol transferase [Rhodobium orientis]|uniref:Phosphatidylglycerol--prolipoprotein diacylglyceryl transferase n=1 Tax=Rhodobium orientis TaxID=34017 RepID=A0A327JXJ2_9HYPH|nr:prolipoprotein diacylglyceryl transferase [Rhodobium orientis]MBB4301178.1 phosphatidylglycerol:prolipoprotein diacylglycerol transferase [Rhodobium orientis]MBK5949811.1 prolipoprotein diacylglyceryl transferase [Rhodobium orientis]RAI30233.1 prolipoprotein diacylglyceryl transferase [Rhodobium orientis]